MEKGVSAARYAWSAQVLRSADVCEMHQGRRAWPSQGAEHRLLEKAPTRLHRTTIPRPEPQDAPTCTIRTATSQHCAGLRAKRLSSPQQLLHHLRLLGASARREGTQGAKGHTCGILGSLRMTVCRLFFALSATSCFPYWSSAKELAPEHVRVMQPVQLVKDSASFSRN